MDLPAAAAKRRRALAKHIGDGIAVLCSAPETLKSRDTPYHPYRQDSYLYYLSGSTEPQTALVLTARNGKIRDEIFFCRAADDADAQWHGPRLTPTTARRQLQIADTATIDRLPQFLAAHAGGYEKLYYLPAHSSAVQGTITDMVQQRRLGNRGGNRAPALFADISVPLDEMRLIKDKTEMDAIRAACRLSCDGMKAAMRAAAAARNECEVDAAIGYTYRAAGGDHAFPPIVAGGGNACILHYTRNNARLKKNKLLLVDSGGELNGYAGDITRTFPANGEWDGAAREVHDIVLDAQRRVIALARVGTRWSSLERAAIRRLAKGLHALGLCRGTVETIILREKYKRFYMHRIGHWLGLDVHDVGAMTEADGTARRLRAGMVLTVEPGLYIPNHPDIPKHLRGIGVRIEDDILITNNGNEVLTADAPKTPSAIRQWMRD